MIPLTDGNYIVDSPKWGKDTGAVTWADGSEPTGEIVSSANSLVGTVPGDEVGGGLLYNIDDDPYSVGGVTPLDNGNYVVDSPLWNYDCGAVTWGDGSTGITGQVSSQNSLVGQDPRADEVGLGGIIARKQWKLCSRKPGLECFSRICYLGERSNGYHRCCHLRK